MCGTSLVFAEQSVWMPVLYHLLHSSASTSVRLHQLNCPCMLSGAGKQVHINTSADTVCWVNDSTVCATASLCCCTLSILRPCWLIPMTQCSVQRDESARSCHLGRHTCGRRCRTIHHGCYHSVYHRHCLPKWQLLARLITLNTVARHTHTPNCCRES